MSAMFLAQIQLVTDREFFLRSGIFWLTRQIRLNGTMASGEAWVFDLTPGSFPDGPGFSAFQILQNP